jgi:hypothetical protein
VIFYIYCLYKFLCVYTHFLTKQHTYTKNTHTVHTHTQTPNTTLLHTTANITQTTTKNTHFYKTKKSKRERNRKKEKERCTPSTILRTNNHYLPLSTIKPSQTTLKKRSEPKQKGKKKRDFICKCFFVS